MAQAAVDYAASLKSQVGIKKFMPSDSTVFLGGALSNAALSNATYTNAASM